MSFGGGSVPVPIEYEVTAGADGEAYYQWDKYGFGQKLIGTALMSALLDMARTVQAPKDKQVTEQQPAAPAPEPPPAATRRPQAASIMEAWKKQVRLEIAGRAEKLTDMPAGKQRMRFRIGPDGEITMAKAVEPVENPMLADRLVKLLEGADHVIKPPLNRVMWIEVTFSF